MRCRVSKTIVNENTRECKAEIPIAKDGRLSDRGEDQRKVRECGVRHEDKGSDRQTSRQADKAGE